MERSTAAVHGPVASSSQKAGVVGSTAGGRTPRSSIACGVTREAVASQGGCWTARPQQTSLWGDAWEGGQRWEGLLGGGTPLD